MAMTSAPFFYSDIEIKNDIDNLLELMNEYTKVGLVMNENHTLEDSQLNTEQSNIVVQYCTLTTKVEDKFMTIANKIIKRLLNRPDLITSVYQKITYPIDETIRAQILQCIGFNETIDNLIPLVRKQKATHDKVYNFMKSNFPDIID